MPGKFTDTAIRGTGSLEKAYKLADGCGFYLAKKNFDGLGYVPSTVPQEMELCLTRLEHLSFPHGAS